MSYKVGAPPQAETPAVDLRLKRCLIKFVHPTPKRGEVRYGLRRLKRSLTKLICAPGTNPRLSTSVQSPSSGPISIQRPITIQRSNHHPAVQSASSVQSPSSGPITIQRSNHHPAVQSASSVQSPSSGPITIQRSNHHPAVQSPSSNTWFHQGVASTGGQLNPQCRQTRS